MTTDKPLAPFLELKKISISFSGRLLLEDVCLSFSRGEWILFLGANGSGKTSLLRLISGRLKNWQGELIVEGETYTSSTWNVQKAYEHGIAMVEQLPDLPDGILAWEYLLWGLKYQGSPFYLNSEKAIAQIKEKLPFTRHFSFDLRAPLGELSLSDRFRLCVASALLRARTLVLWDESTIFLGHEEKSFLPELVGILAGQGLAALMVTHENLPWAKEVGSLYILEERKISSLSPADIESKLIHYKAQNLERVADSASEIMRAETNHGMLVVRKGEIVSLIADSEIPLRVWENFFWGKKSLLSGKLFLEGQDISTARFSDRRKRMGWIVPALGAQEEEAIFSLLFPFLFDGSHSFSNSLFLSKFRWGEWSQKTVPAYLWGRLGSLWRVLSGGEKQGIILSRELARRPKFLVASFPTQGLDKDSIELFWRRMHKFAGEEGGSLLILSTEEVEARAFSHTVYKLDGLELKKEEEAHV